MKVKYVNDYVKQVHEKFPELTEDEVKRIINYGWKMMLQYVSIGNDLSVTTNNFFFFIGRLPKNSLKAFETYCKKLAFRIQYMFKRTYSEWDKYYYFTRTENQYKDYLQQSKKKKKLFKDVFLYRLLEQAKIAQPNAQYIFRLTEDKSKKFVKYYKELKTDKAELIIHRDSLNMDDVMVTNNKYKYLQR